MPEINKINPWNRLEKVARKIFKVLLKRNKIYLKQNKVSQIKLMTLEKKKFWISPKTAMKIMY